MKYESWTGAKRRFLRWEQQSNMWPFQVFKRDLLLCHLNEVSIFLLLIQAGLLLHLQFVWAPVIFTVSFFHLNTCYYGDFTCCWYKKKGLERLREHLHEPNLQIKSKTKCWWIRRRSEPVFQVPCIFYCVCGTAWISSDSWPRYMGKYKDKEVDCRLRSLLYPFGMQH